MSETIQPPKPRSGKRRLLRILLGVFAAVVILACVLLGWIGLSIAPEVILFAKKAKLQNEMVQVQTAVMNYYTEYSEYPAASDNATLIQMLYGKSAKGNSRQIAFISFKPSDLDAKGELLDPWGTPVQLSMTAVGKLTALSAGPDQTFGTADDISGDKDLGPP